jgi:hypothetical protein
MSQSTHVFTDDPSFLHQHHLEHDAFEHDESLPLFDLDEHLLQPTSLLASTAQQYNSTMQHHSYQHSSSSTIMMATPAIIINDTSTLTISSSSLNHALPLSPSSSPSISVSISSPNMVVRQPTLTRMKRKGAACAVCHSHKVHCSGGRPCERSVTTFIIYPTHIRFVESFVGCGSTGVLK